MYLTLAIALCCLPISALHAMPSVYPAGTTFYKPAQCLSGYAILSGFPGATLIDMNGNVVKQWNINATSPNKILPGGNLLTGMRGKGKELSSMVQVDWDGNIIWEFNRFEQVAGSAGRRSVGFSKSKW